MNRVALPVVIAIDGPAGSGKSTIAGALAGALDLPHVDTGAFYRAATLAVLNAGADPRDAEACLAVVRRLDIARRAGRTMLGGQDVEAEIRGAAVTAAVSAVSAHRAVREALLAAQRAGVGSRGAVVEGRDAGTVVVPDASLKIWLTASVETRAARRAAQVGEDPAAQLADIARRDQQDARQMVPAPDAVTVDTTGRTVGEIVDELVRLVATSGAH